MAVVLFFTASLIVNGQNKSKETTRQGLEIIILYAGRVVEEP